ncbi:ArsR family transcriptional regulator [Arthrobacter sp. SW1]|uniref:LysR family transcriptional regulator n=1 Tax=Arthrobacter sp. SW1 TaxID=1920889 RepID=UPI000877B753|nr:LysR family transcriptional regulator [Arthrobacter sp. SW1]OFI39694.1 ArsR family transcriptional regulator [Arthrobacter sp. SW1]
MDFKRLRILRELADRRTVGATAEAMNVTASAVSQQLKALQDELGVVLVEKDGRGVRLTEAGRAMAEAAAEVATAMARAESTMDAYRQGWQSRIRAAFFPSAAEMLLPGLLHRLKDIAGLRLEAHFEDPGAEGFAGLAADYDIVLAHSVDGADVFARHGLEVLPLLEEPVDIAMPAGHELAAKQRLTAHDVAGYPWIGVPPGFPFDAILRQIELQAGTTAAQIQRFPDLRVLEALVKGGHGICLLPRYTARSGGDHGLVLRPLDGVRAGRSIVALARPEVAARTTVRRTLGLLREEARLVAVLRGP